MNVYPLKMIILGKEKCKIKMSELYICEYCDLSFAERKLLLSHQKTKKCTLHRNLLFKCRKCLVEITGYANGLAHAETCDVFGEVNLQRFVSALKAQANQSGFDVEETAQEFRAVPNPSGIGRCLPGGQTVGSVVLRIKARNIYTHPEGIACKVGITVPQKLYLIKKLIAKPLDVIRASVPPKGYFNDVFSQILNQSELAQILALKLSREEFSQSWLNSAYPSLIKKQGEFYALSKVQCKDELGRKWFGDTSLLSDKEHVHRLVWAKDVLLRQTFCNFYPILKDLVNLYLILGKQALKKEKIKTKEVQEAGLIDVLSAHGLTNLVENIQMLSNYDLFFSHWEKNVASSVETYDNVEQVFSEENLPAKFGDHFNYCSLMNLSDQELTDNAYYHLMHHVLPESEKPIFAKKDK
jgi:hypothetical protein